MKIALHEHLLNLFFPNLCLICNKTLNADEKQICIRCILDIPRTNYHLRSDNPVEKRFWGKAQVHRATSFYFFQKGSAFQKLIHQLKYKGNTEVGIIIGKHAAVDLMESGFFTDIDYLIPVPLHPKKLASRGYNQCDLIAQGISAITHIPINNDTLKRIKENCTQTKKTIFERFENTQDIFVLSNKNTLQQKHILLIDDVLTTGSTLEACINEIHKSEGVKVSIFTIALA